MPDGVKSGKVIAALWLLGVACFTQAVEAASPVLQSNAFLNQMNEVQSGVDASSPNYAAFTSNTPGWNADHPGAPRPGAPAGSEPVPDPVPGIAYPDAAPPGPMPGAMPADGMLGFFGRRFCQRPDDCLPRVYFEVDALAMRLAEDKSRPMAALTSTNNIVLTTGNLEFDFKASPRFLVGYVIDKEYQLEFSYFDLANFVERASATDTPGRLLSPFFGFGQPVTVGFDLNQVVEIKNSNATNDLELNLRHQLPMPPIPLAASFLCGVRYMNIREGFGYFSQSAQAPTAGAPGSLNFVTTNTENELVGFQIGALFQLGIDPKWWTEFEMKGGIYNNSARQETEYVHVENDVESFFGERDADRTAYVGDLRWSLAYQFNRHLTTHIGYQAIGIHGLALAYQNASFNVDVLRNEGPAELNHKGSVYYHGPFAGLTVAW